MSTYYNEFDPKAAAWLRELIKQGLIASGDVDERSIEDVRPDDLKGYTQCHFFAGIGVWSRAARNAGWDDNRPLWSASCPCQPFSAAGEGAGFTDERHLWPSLYWLIEHAKPKSVPIVGEQVAAKAALLWLDLVQSDMEAAGYPFGKVDFCAAGVGAPEIRQRMYWMADTDDAEWRSNISGRNDADRHAPRWKENNSNHRTHCSISGLASSSSAGLERRMRSKCNGVRPHRQASPCGAAGGLEHTYLSREYGWPSGGEQSLYYEHNLSIPGGYADPVNGFWGNADWLRCRDERWRPVEPGTFPLAHGITARMGRLRGYGNAVVLPQAQAWIETVMEVIAFS